MILKTGYSIHPLMVKELSDIIKNIGDVTVPSEVTAFLSEDETDIFFKNQGNLQNKYKYFGYDHMFQNESDETIADYYRNVAETLFNTHPEIIAIGVPRWNTILNNENVFSFNEKFIKDHLKDLIHLKDYVPLGMFGSYIPDKYPGGAMFPPYKTRDEFLNSYEGDYLLKTIREMDMVVYQKCFNSPDPVKSVNTIIIEWLDCHPEFEGIIAKESWGQYQQMKAIYDEFTFINLLYDVELSYEKKVWVPPKGEGSLRDDSSIQLPDFKKIDELFDKHEDSLLLYYLSYLV